MNGYVSVCKAHEVSLAPVLLLSGFDRNANAIRQSVFCLWVDMACVCVRVCMCVLASIKDKCDIEALLTESALKTKSSTGYISDQEIVCYLYTCMFKLLGKLNKLNIQF